MLLVRVSLVTLLINSFSLDTQNFCQDFWHALAGDRYVVL